MTATTPTDSDRTPTSPLRRILDGALVVVLVLLGLLLVVTVIVPRVKGYVPLTILSGSMEPSLPVGSQVFVDPVQGRSEAEDEVRTGSVITYMPYPDDPTLVTHRVVRTSYATDGSPRWRTQGDANSSPDETVVGPKQLRGVVRYHVPFVGYVASGLDREHKETIAIALAGCLFAYAAWNLLLAFREGRAGPEGDGRDAT